MDKILDTLKMNLKGIDSIFWRVSEREDAVCSAPFIVDKGEQKAPSLVAKLAGKSLFRKKKYEVNLNNFAKVKCYGKPWYKDKRKKHIHCVGIDIYGEPVATELAGKQKKVIELSLDIWQDLPKRAEILTHYCRNVLINHEKAKLPKEELEKLEDVTKDQEKKELDLHKKYMESLEEE